jgi:hypothetical protein
MNKKKRQKIIDELFPLTLNIQKEDGEVVFSSNITLPTFRKIVPELIAADISNVQPMKGTLK